MKIVYRRLLSCRMNTSNIFAKLPDDAKEVVIKHLTDNTRNHAILMFELQRYSKIMLKERCCCISCNLSVDCMKKVDTYDFIDRWIIHTPLFSRSRVWLPDSDDSDYY